MASVRRVFARPIQADRFEDGFRIPGQPFAHRLFLQNNLHLWPRNFALLDGGPNRSLTEDEL